MRTFWASLLVSSTTIGVALAQPPGFEVATVKVLPPVPLGSTLSVNLGTYRNGSLTLTNVTLSECLQFAYGLVSEEQVAGPDWIKSRDAARFDIVAKTTADVELERARPMLRALLEDRLKLVAHNAPRPFSFLALVPAKGGPKLVAADESQTAPAQNSFVPGRITGRAPMQVLALLLSRFERQLVLDRTGLTGRYQLKLEWAPEVRINGVGGDADPRPSLASALQEQLGLRLESRKEPIDVIVVDRAEKMPTEN